MFCKNGLNCAGRLYHLKGIGAGGMVHCVYSYAARLIEKYHFKTRFQHEAELHARLSHDATDPSASCSEKKHDKPRRTGARTRRGGMSQRRNKTTHRKKQLSR